MREMIFRYIVRTIIVNDSNLKRKTKSLFQVKVLFFYYKLSFMFVCENFTMTIKFLG